MRLPKSALVISLVFFSVFAASRAAHAQSLRGGRASVERIYRQALAHELYFYETPAGARKAAASGKLVHLKGNANYRVSGVRYPYVLPSTHTFITRLAPQYRAACGEKLVVTSGIRPRSFRLSNSVDKTVHPTGMAVDLRKSGRRKCQSWLRETLLYLEGKGTIDAVEERNPPHFHVAVFPRPYGRYVQSRGGEVRLASGGEAGEKTGAFAGGGTYRVRRGDSLWTIARRHGTSVERIKRANDMSGSRLQPGQVLVIPKAK